MRKNTGNKVRPSLKGSGSLPTYFTPTERCSPGAVKVGEEDKMAPAYSNSSTLMRQDLLDLGTNLKSNFSSMIVQKLAPISKQLANHCANLREVSHTADTALEVSMALQVESKRLQQRETILNTKVIYIESQLRGNNLKFYGLPELPEFNANISGVLASWLASMLKLEDEVASTILLAYHLGPISAVNPNFLGGIIAQFL